MKVGELQRQVLSYGEKSYNYYCNNLVTTANSDTSTEWSSGTRYEYGEYVKIDSLKRKFRCANVSGSTNKHPVSFLGIDWVDFGAINEYSMFDDTLSSQTIATSDFSVTIDFNSCNTLTIQNIENIISIRFYQMSSDELTTYYDSGDIYMRDTARINKYDYRTRPIVELVKYTDLYNLSWYAVSRLKVEFTIASGANAKIGFMGVSYTYDLGCTLYGSSAGYEDYSQYVEDDFGFTSFSRRPTINKINGQVLIDNKNIDYALETLKRLRGRLSHYIGDERDTNRLQSLDIIGYVKKLTIPIDNPTKNKYPIEIIGGV